jgi:thymidylate synthase ThyX
MSEFSRQIYLLDPKELSPETIAVTFAKTSRSPESFREIAQELTEAKSADFNEKWVVGYGHASVAEHAVLHFAIENISRLAVETIQSSRLASFTEKSTRYQKWSSNAFYTPSEVIDAGFVTHYEDICQMLFSTYERALQACREVTASDCPIEKGEKPSSYERRLKSIYVDSCRFLLPASSLANLGMTANARVIEHLVTKLLSHPLAEVNAVGEEIKLVARTEIPTLVKYADRDEYIEQLPKKLNQDFSTQTITNNKQNWCELVDYSPNGEAKVLAAILYRYGCESYQTCLERVIDMSQAEKQALTASAFAGMGKFDWPLREAEHLTYSFDVLMDQGAYYEVKRHRMMTQSPQELTCRFGYATPKLIERAGFDSEYAIAMDGASIAYDFFAGWNPAVAAYVVPNGFYRRALLTMNFREAFQFVQLRSAPGAHFSVRRIAQRMAEQIRKVHPLLGAYLRPCADETWQDIEANYFA